MGGKGKAAFGDDDVAFTPAPVQETTFSDDRQQGSPIEKNKSQETLAAPTTDAVQQPQVLAAARWPVLK